MAGARPRELTFSHQKGNLESKNSSLFVFDITTATQNFKRGVVDVLDVRRREEEEREDGHNNNNNNNNNN